MIELPTMITQYHQCPISEECLFLYEETHMKWLWTWYDNPDVPIPNTNNILEAMNTDLKTKLRVHNGMSKRYRKLFIDEYFKLKYKQKMRANTRIYLLSLTNNQKPPRFYVLF